MSVTSSAVRHRIFLALILLLALLQYIQVFTLESVKAAMLGDQSISAYSVDLSGRASMIAGALSPPDWCALAGVAAVLLWLILSEIRGGRIRGELDAVTSSGPAALILLGLLSVIATRFYLAPGELMLGDSALHAQRAWCAARSLSEGRWPSWSFFNYCGYPFLQFYGPLFYLVTAVTGGLFGGVGWSIKVWMFLFHAGSSFPVYFWSRAIGAKRAGALLAGIAYVLTFHHTHTVIWTGALQMSAVFFFFPLLLLAIEKTLLRRSGAWLPVVSIATAALVLTHQGYAVYGLQLAAVYILLRLLLSGGSRPDGQSVAASFIGMGCGVLLCSIALWPSLFQNEGVYWPSELPLLKPVPPTAAFLRQILLWRNMWSGWTSSYIGISLCAFAVAGPLLVRRRDRRSSQHRIFRAAAVAAVFSLLCAGSGGRVSNLSLPFLALLAGGAVGLSRKLSAGGSLMILLAVLWIDLGPTTVQSPYRRDAAFISEGLRTASAAISPHRAIYGYRSAAGTGFFYWADGRLTDIILPTGFFPQGAPHSLNGIIAMVDRLNESEGTLDQELKDLLYLWDVAGLLTYTRDRFVPPGISGAEAVEGNPPIARIDPAGPLIFSERIEAAPDDTLRELQRRELLQGLERGDEPRRAFRRRMRVWVQRMKLDRENGVSASLFLPEIDPRWRSACRGYWGSGGTGGGGAPIEEAGSLSFADAGAGAPETGLTVTDYRVGMYRASVRYRCGAKGFIRMAFSWYPTLKVLVDGEPAPAARSLLGAIVIPTRPGEHTIELVPTRPVRVPAAVLTLVPFIIMPVTVRAVTARGRRR